MQGPGHTHWTSEDYGKTFSAHRTPGGTLGYGAEIKIHPTQPNWVLSLVRRPECHQVRFAAAAAAAAQHCKTRSSQPWMMCT